VLQPCQTPPDYSEQEAVAASHLGIKTIHHLQALGVIQGETTEGEQRYSKEEVIQLRQIRRLQYDLGINMAGIEVILHLLKHLEEAHNELALERNKASRRDDIP